MTRHDMRECMFCLLFQNEFYGTEEFAEQRDTFLEEKNLNPVNSRRSWRGHLI